MNIQIRKQSSPYNGYRYSMRTMYGQQQEELLIEGEVFAQRNIDRNDDSSSQKWKVVDEYSKVVSAIDSLIERLYKKQETDYLNYDDIYNKLHEFCTDDTTCAEFAREIKEYADISRKKAEILKNGIFNADYITKCEILCDESKREGSCVGLQMYGKKDNYIVANNQTYDTKIAFKKLDEVQSMFGNNVNKILIQGFFKNNNMDYSYMDRMLEFVPSTKLAKTVGFLTVALENDELLNIIRNTNCSRRYADTECPLFHWHSNSIFDTYINKYLDGKITANQCEIGLGIGFDLKQSTLEEIEKTHGVDEVRNSNVAEFLTYIEKATDYKRIAVQNNINFDELMHDVLTNKNMKFQTTKNEFEKTVQETFFTEFVKAGKCSLEEVDLIKSQLPLQRKSLYHIFFNPLAVATPEAIECCKRNDFYHQAEALDIRIESFTEKALEDYAHGEITIDRINDTCWKYLFELAKEKFPEIKKFFSSGQEIKETDQKAFEYSLLNPFRINKHIDQDFLNKMELEIDKLTKEKEMIQKRAGYEELGERLLIKCIESQCTMDEITKMANHVKRDVFKDRAEFGIRAKEIAKVLGIEWKEAKKIMELNDLNKLAKPEFQNWLKEQSQRVNEPVFIDENVAIER